ncbi:hypothetical protein [Microbacterium sp. 22242]|uniref:hypothetical protein n=1 Tax=Microbacterium sp. 22242 TaxID=3453896 RepID=UPI003F827F97
MRAPGTVVRIVCAFTGVVVAPIAVGLISSGGGAWAIAQMQFSYRRTGLPLDRLIGPTLLILLGLLLLAGVVLTGLFSATGLIAAGVVGILPALGTLAPGAALGVFTSRLVPIPVIEPLAHGLPAAILPLLGFMGLTLVTVRLRPPRESAATALLGAVTALLALALGGVLLMWGVQLGISRAFTNFDTRFHPLPAALVLLALVLIGVGVGASRWSWFALVLPAMVLLVLSLINVLSFALYAAGPRDIAQPTGTFLILGGGVAVAVAELAFTAVLLVLRARTRRIGPTTAAGPGLAANAVPGAHPAGMGYPAAPPQTGLTGAQPSAPPPPAPPAPPAT